ncbi:MAG: K+/H+ antiporter subunit F [Natronospirillum sp.]|uniref:K+/H+ antiporter subunit F n=1 Tax=Natronospirillum sp. TaxID=2812955 RepID=UPI0025DF3F30|nr:K+/H+ antiporter subunit F [Natronospirillum sp.]MCH8551426.1 K+/H+ antiporter subunit F [Natronospirillum sp.]
MLRIAVIIAMLMFTVSVLLNLYRMVRGPDLADRILTLDSLYVNAIAMIILLGIFLGSTLFFEAAMLIAMMGFVGTVAVCKYLLRGNIIE